MTTHRVVYVGGPRDRLVELHDGLEADYSLSEFADEECRVPLGRYECRILSPTAAEMRWKPERSR